MIKMIEESEVSSIIGGNPHLLKSWVGESFRHQHAGTIIQPQKTYLQISNNPYDRAIALPAYVRGDDPVAGIKWIGSHSENISRGLERASAVIILNDPTTMHPVAVMEGSLISSMRTCAVSMLMLDKFTDTNETLTVGIIGMGKLGKLHAKFLGDMYEQVDTVLCYSKTAPLEDVLHYPKVRAAQNLGSLLTAADVIITATNARLPYILPEHISAKTRLIVNLSLMDFSLDVMMGSKHLIVDDWEQNTKAKKVFRDGVDSRIIIRSMVEEIGEVLFGPNKPRDGRVFVNPLGMGIEDVVVAKRIYDIVMEPSLHPSPPIGRFHKQDADRNTPS